MMQNPADGALALFLNSMARHKITPVRKTAGHAYSPAAANPGALGACSAVEVAKDVAPARACAPLALSVPNDDQFFYLRMLVRHLCTRKGIKTLTLADSAGIAGNQKQKENKTQAFLNRYSRGASAIADYRAFWNGVLSLHQEYKRNGVELFDDPVMRQAFALVFPQLFTGYSKDNSFIDDPLLKWLSIDLERSKDVCRHYSGLWWIVRPSTKSRRGLRPEFKSRTPQHPA